MFYKEQNKSMVIKDINIKVPKLTMNWNGEVYKFPKIFKDVCIHVLS